MVRTEIDDRLMHAVFKEAARDNVDPMALVFREINLAFLDGNRDFLPEDQYVLVEVVGDGEDAKLVFQGSRQTEDGANILAEAIVARRQSKEKVESFFYVLMRKPSGGVGLLDGKEVTVPSRHSLQGFKWYARRGF